MTQTMDRAEERGSLMPEEKKPDGPEYVFDEPIQIEVLIGGQIMSAGPTGQMSRELKVRTAEIGSPKGVGDFMQAIAQKQFVLRTPLAVQLALNLYARLGFIVEKGKEKAGPTGIVG